jgi:small-conductance mechanosensitive channel
MSIEKASMGPRRFCAIISPQGKEKMESTVRAGLVPFTVFLIVTTALLVIRSAVFRVLAKRTRESGKRALEVTLDVLRIPSIYWCIAAGLEGGLALSALRAAYVHYITRTILLLIIFSVTLVTANICVSIFRQALKRSDIPIPTTGIVFGVVKGVVLIVGILVILNMMGVSVTPIITALGVGGLAVALALQDTLANLFAGLHIIASRQFHPGDIIRLDTGEEGVITDVTWRTTTIHTFANSITIIPNTKISKATITNYNLPEPEIVVPIQMTLRYGVDLAEAEQIVLAAAREVAATTAVVVPGDEPLFRFQALGELGTQCSVFFRTRQFTDQYLLRHEFIKSLEKRFEAAGILSPFPTRSAAP